MGQCPRCGSGNVYSFNESDKLTPSEDRWFVVICKSCGNEKRTHYSIQDYDTINIDRTKEEWNL